MWLFASVVQEFKLQLAVLQIQRMVKAGSQLGISDSQEVWRPDSATVPPSHITGIRLDAVSSLRNLASETIFLNK